MIQTRYRLGVAKNNQVTYKQVNNVACCADSMFHSCLYVFLEVEDWW